MLIYVLIHIAISAEGFALFLVFILWRHREKEALMVANRKHVIVLTEVGLEEYKSVTDIARILKKH